MAPVANGAIRLFAIKLTMTNRLIRGRHFAGFMIVPTAKLFAPGLPSTLKKHP